MMTKFWFQVGDLVKVVLDLGTRLNKGEIGVVTGYDQPFYRVVFPDGNKRLLLAMELMKVDP